MYGACYSAQIAHELVLTSRAKQTADFKSLLSWYISCGCAFVNNSINHALYDAVFMERKNICNVKNETQLDLVVG